MKLFSTLILVLFFISCQHNDGEAIITSGSTLQVNGITVITDTIITNEKGLLEPILIYNNSYYCLLHSKDSLGQYNAKYFCIISNNGGTKNIEGLSGYNEFGYNDIHIRHDSVMVKSYFDENSSFYIDEQNKKAIPIKTVDDVVFEDNDYYVTALDFGEWGSATWFRDKKTGIEYIAAGFITPEIRKFKGAYYLISPGEINVVDNPKLLENAGKGAYRSFLGEGGAGKFYEREYKGYTKGLRNIFSRKITYERESNFCIGLAFTHNDGLRFIVSDSAATYIAKAEGKKLIPVANIGKGIKAIRRDNVYRNLYLNKTIPFSTGKEGVYGLLEVKGNNILLHYFKNVSKSK